MKRLTADEREADRQERAERDLERIDATEARADEVCDVCHGSGLVTRQYGGDGYGDRCCGLADADDQPCTACQPDPYAAFWVRRVTR